MNIILPIHFRSADYQIEYNEPDSTRDRKNYLVRIESIKCNSDPDAEMEAQTGKEFEFKGSEKFSPDIAIPLDLIKKTYGDHIAKDVECLKRV
jgi:hypothetical protein